MEKTRLFDYKEHRVITEYDTEKVNDLIDSGNAVKLDLPELSELERKADEIHNSYKKAVEKVRADDNPLMTDEVKAYEIDKLTKQMKEESDAIEEEYQAWKSEQLEQAKARKARAVVNVTKNDEQVASQYIDRAALRLATATDDDKSVIVSEIVNDVKHMSDSEKTAMQSLVPKLFDGLSQRDKNRLATAVQDIRNGDLLAVKVAEQLPHTVLTKRRRDDIVKQVMSQSNATDSISREFYEKHLKGDDK